LAQASAFDTLAGMFAAKEAVIKALAMKAGEWRKIEIGKNNHGRPEARLADFSRRIVAHDLSISHDGEYAVAAAVFLLESE
jgi:phosphopantetheine--protein transferase-like protein